MMPNEIGRNATPNERYKAALADPQVNAIRAQNTAATGVRVVLHALLILLWWNGTTTWQELFALEAFWLVGCLAAEIQFRWALARAINKLVSRE